jgi:hypothetical protein
MQEKIVVLQKKVLSEYSTELIPTLSIPAFQKQKEKKERGAEAPRPLRYAPF